MFLEVYLGQCGFGGRPETRSMCTSSSGPCFLILNGCWLSAYCVSWNKLGKADVWVHFFSSVGLWIMCDSLNDEVLWAATETKQNISDEEKLAFVSSFWLSLSLYLPFFFGLNVSRNHFLYLMIELPQKRRRFGSVGRSQTPVMTNIKNTNFIYMCVLYNRCFMNLVWLWDLSCG